MGPERSDQGDVVEVVEEQVVERSEHEDAEEAAEEGPQNSVKWNRGRTRIVRDTLILGEVVGSTVICC